jgi:hypothetical protein
MAPNWTLTAIAGISIFTAACQPTDVDDRPLVKPPRPEAAERERRRIDQRVERYQARWKALKQQYASQ